MLFLFRIRNLWKRHKAERLMVDTSILQVHAREVFARFVLALRRFEEESDCPRRKLYEEL